jgi:hypothetical protein
MELAKELGVGYNLKESHEIVIDVVVDFNG